MIYLLFPVVGCFIPVFIYFSIIWVFSDTDVICERSSECWSTWDMCVYQCRPVQDNVHIYTKK